MQLFLLEENPTILNPAIKTKKYPYQYFEVEEHQLLQYISVCAATIGLDWIMDRDKEFYKLFLDWEDASLIIEDTSKEN